MWARMSSLRMLDRHHCGEARSRQIVRFGYDLSIAQLTPPCVEQRGRDIMPSCYLSGTQTHSDLYSTTKSAVTILGHAAPTRNTSAAAQLRRLASRLGSIGAYDKVVMPLRGNQHGAAFDILSVEGPGMNELQELGATCDAARQAKRASPKFSYFLPNLDGCLKASRRRRRHR